MFGESVSEWAWYVGTDNPEHCWLLHPGDVWVRNPHYRGPVRMHPEDEYDASEPLPGDDAPLIAHLQDSDRF